MYRVRWIGTKHERIIEADNLKTAKVLFAKLEGMEYNKVRFRISGSKIK